MVGQPTRFGLGYRPMPVWLGALVLLLAVGARGTQADTFTVDRTDDLPDLTTPDNQCRVAIGPPPVCTLRAAIMEANALGGSHLITFAVGTGTQTITVTSPLPTASAAVTIDGTTQPGYAGTPLIMLHGNGVAGSGLTLGGTGGCTVRGLVIRHFGQRGIQILSGSNGNTIAGNYIGRLTFAGTDAGAAEENGAQGIELDGANNVIGGAAATDRNVIAGNGVDGILIYNAAATGNRIVGNYIGVDATGRTALGNVEEGVQTWNANNNIIGEAGAGNVIGDAGSNGISVLQNSSGTVIQGNWIGTNTFGDNLGNRSRGIDVNLGSSNTTIGGTVAGQGNVIAYNTQNAPGTGVKITTGPGSSILGNRIFSNGGLGIDIDTLGVTANDTNDGDGGANLRQNFPVLSAAMTNGAGSATFAGSLNSAQNTTYRIEFFASSAQDPTGFGEGQRYLGFANVSTPVGNNNAVFGVTLTTALAAGEYVTATATDPASNTSEFSAAIQAYGLLIVTTTAETVDGNTASVSALIANPGNPGDGRISLREAITATNNTLGTDTIRFGIPIADAGHVYYQNDGVAGFAPPTQTTLADLATASSPVISDYDTDYPAGTARSWYRITLGSALPLITSPVVLDTTTQPLSVAGTGPVVELNGAAAAAGSNGLDLQEGSDGSTIRGFVINRFPRRAILIVGSSTNVVAGNFLGTNPAGTAAGPGNGGGGIRVGGVATTGRPTNNNTVGGTLAADRNVISGNTVDGVNIGAGAPPNSNANNVVQGNYIGTDVTGTVAVPNTAQGVAVFNNGTAGPSTDTVIGGTAPGAGNVISGNGNVGVLLRDPETTRTLVQGNKIGTNAAGTAALPNRSSGVQINVATSNNTVGGTAAGAGNLIAYNNSNNNAGQGGVAFVAGTGNSTLGNSIYANTGLGIDLGWNGVTPNDALDADPGPNNLLNFPQLMSASPSAGTVTVWFRLDVPAGSYRIEFFRNPSGTDASGNGEGQAFAGSTNVTHPGGGARSFSGSFAGVTGDVITATTTACTDGAACAAFGSTSEFSNAVTAFTTVVELMSFTATGADGAVDLAWQTGSELDNLGFHLYRSPSSAGPWTRLNASLIPGLGSSPVGASYSWHDGGLENGTRYYYRLEDVDASSVSTSHGPVSAVPSSSREDGGNDGGEDGTERGLSSCPSWVLAAAPDAVSPACTRHGDPDSVSLEVLSRDEESATLELRTGGFWALHEGAGDGGIRGRVRGRLDTVRVFVAGLEFPSDPRSPSLPVRRALVEAVVGKGVELVSAEALDLRSFPGLRPSAVGVAEMAVGRDGTVRPSRRAVDAPALSRGLVPREVARLAGTVFQEERKSAVVEIAPVRFARSGRSLLLAGRVRVRLAFTGAADGERGTGGRGHSLPRRGALRDVVAQLHTSRRGLHAVGFEELFPQGRGGLPTALLRLQRQGEAVAFHVEPPKPVFGPGSVLYFFAARTPSSTEYSPEVAYELVRSRGAEMGVVSAAPLGPPVTRSATALASFETNRIYQPDLLEAKDIWLWEALASGVSRTETFTLSGVSTSSGQEARLAVDLQGASESGLAVDHHVRVWVNGTELGEATFAGKRPQRVEVSFAASQLREGANELEVTNAGDTGVASRVFLDRFEVSYPLVAGARDAVFEGVWGESGTVEVGGLTGRPVILSFPSASPSTGAEESATAANLSGPVAHGGAWNDGGVHWLTGFEASGSSVRFQAEAGARYAVVSAQGLLSPRIGRVVPSRLRERTNGAEYLVVAPREFLGAAEPLLERRREEGLASRGVSLEEIASEFGHGQESAEAIREFLTYAYHSWRRPSPRYVLLLGDSTVDPQHFVATSGPSPLPALWTRTSYLWTVSDPALGAVNGDDLIPDLAIGRLPAATVEEAERLVGKVLAWEESGQGLGGMAVLVADDPDRGGDFEWDVEDIRSSYLSSRPTSVVKVSQLGGATRAAILGAFDEGASLMSYVGHGGTAVWATENVLNDWDVPALRAQSRQPLLLTMNCLNGYFVAPNLDALSEALLKAEGRGVAAAFSPSSLSLDGPAHEYHRAVMAELTRGTHFRLGDAILAAQRTYAETGLMPELLDVYQLLGDPALRIR